MRRSRLFFLSVALALFGSPSILSAGYVYPGSAGLQPLAIIEPATPDSLFHSWTGDIHRNGRSNLGASLNFLRNPDDSEDWDEILAVTGSFRSGERFFYGFTIPYIIRDPEFNESGLLDLRGFARIQLLGSSSGFGASGELSAILPTAKENASYPFTLDSPVMGVRLAFFGGTGETRLGMNFGYQRYVNTDSGDDSDTLYSAWMERDLSGLWSMTAEFSGSRHDHSGPPGDDNVLDACLLLGVRGAPSDKVNFGIAAGSGIGGDRSADILVTALATLKFGTVEKKAEERKIERKKTFEEEKKVQKPEKEVVQRKKMATPPPGTIVVVMIGEGITGKETEKRITQALQLKGYATGKDPKPGVKNTGRNVLYYMPSMLEKALDVSRNLVSGGHLKDLQVEESKVRLPGSWLLLILGGEK